MYYLLSVYALRDPDYSSVDHRRGKGSSACLYCQTAETDVLVNYNWPESTQVSSPKGLHLNMVLDISPISWPQRQDCEELINHIAYSSGAVLLAAAIAVGVVNCACCSLDGTGLASLLLLIQGMLDISPGCLGAVFLQLSQGKKCMLFVLVWFFCIVCHQPLAVV